MSPADPESMDGFLCFVGVLVEATTSPGTSRAEKWALEAKAMALVGCMAAELGTSDQTNRWERLAYRIAIGDQKGVAEALAEIRGEYCPAHLLARRQLRLVDGDAATTTPPRGRLRVVGKRGRPRKAGGRP